jgi:hypothetical protein
MKSFAESTFVARLPDASFFASDLFFEAFGTAFPRPPPGEGSPHRAPTGTWHQFVAFYKWSETRVEPVAFVNFIRHGDVYLEGGLCARRGFYRRLPAPHWRECRARGGIVRLMLDEAARQLDDACAWFGYCGDARSWRVSQRVGYERTRHRYLMVKWFRRPPETAQRELEDRIAALGPF